MPYASGNDQARWLVDDLAKRGYYFFGPDDGVDWLAGEIMFTPLDRADDQADYVLDGMEKSGYPLRPTES